jgi:hypothetical protein
MKLKTNLIAIGVVVALGAGQQVVAAQKNEEDSVYKWGRWAVLSPAAGGPPPYVAALEPDAVNNARPEEAEEFSPKVQFIAGPPEVPPGVGPIDPDVPIVVIPPTPPPPPPGVDDVNPGQPIVSLPPTPPPPPPL